MYYRNRRGRGLCRLGTKKLSKEAVMEKFGDSVTLYLLAVAGVFVVLWLVDKLRRK